MPAVSVIVPVYRTKPYLRKCVDSLLAQTFPDFELILVDDGSPDDSGALCDELAALDSRIHVLHKENGGLSSARRVGFQAARGEYLAFVDSDDYVHPDYLKKLYMAAASCGAQLAICGYALVARAEARPIALPWQEAVIEKADIAEKYTLPLVGRIWDGKHINLPGFMCIRLFRKSSVREDFFVSEREFFTEDDVFDILHSQQLDRIAVVQDPLYYYVQHPESLTNRYRPGKWQMLQNRHAFCANWLAEHGLLEAGRERLTAAAFSAVFSSIDNCINRGGYRAFRAQLQELLASELYGEMMSNAVPGQLGRSQRIVYFMLRCRLWYLLYCYRKARLAG